MIKEKYNKINKNIIYYKFRFFLTIAVLLVGLVVLVLLIISLDKGKSNEFNAILFLLILSLMYLYIKFDANHGFLYKEYKAIQKSEILEMKMLEATLVINGLKDRLQRLNYKLKMKNKNITLAHKSNIKYGIFYYRNINVCDIERLKLSKIIHFLNFKKFHPETFFLVNIIITNSFNKDLIEFFLYNGNRFFPQDEIFIGYDLSSNKVYMNYGYSNSTDDFIKELKNIIINEFD